MSNLSHAFVKVLVAELVERRGRVSEELVVRFEEQGDEVIEPLAALLADDASWEQPRAPVAEASAQLLGRTGSRAAAPPLIDALLYAWAHEVRERPFLLALASLGEAMVEPTLRRLARVFDDDARNLLAESLAHSGVRNTKIRTWLLGLLQTDPALAGSLLARYGDDTVLPELAAALDEAPAADSVRVRELADAITDLGGELSAAHQHKYEQSIQIAERVRVPTLIPFDGEDF